MRPNECAGSPLSVNHPGTQWYGPNFHTTRYMRDVLPVGAYHFIGSRLCLFGSETFSSL